MDGTAAADWRKHGHKGRSQCCGASRHHLKLKADSGRLQEVSAIMSVIYLTVGGVHKIWRSYIFAVGVGVGFLYVINKECNLTVVLFS